MNIAAGPLGQREPATGLSSAVRRVEWVLYLGWVNRQAEDWAKSRYIPITTAIRAPAVRDTALIIGY